MSNKSGASNQIISLPQGGGALQGIGATFSPDLHTGTGNFTVPIALPPGRNGFQPELNLVYSTGNGNGPFGMGWGLSIPGVMRKTSQGIPRYDDAEDTFVLSGAEDLVPVEQTATLTRYQPRTEGLFARIEHHTSGAHDYWKVWSKDGLVSYYGTDNVPAGSEDPAMLANPDDLRRDNIYAWRLSRTEDRFGNRIEYEYERHLQQEGSHLWDQLYLKRIRYVDFDDGGATAFLVSVTFEYEDRLDPFSEYRSGFEIRTVRRCRLIQIETHADQTRLVRTYGFTYLDQRADLVDLDQHLPLNGVSLLSQVRVTGHDGTQAEKLPALAFDYSRFEPVGRRFFPVEGKDLPTRSLASPELELADLFGNGLPDILEMNGTVRYWRNLGKGRFDLPRTMQDAPAGLQLADEGVQLIDADGDGRIDLLVTRPGISGYFPLKFGGLWDRQSFQKYDVAPSINLEGPDVQLVDLTGDGVTDAIRSGSRLECFFNDSRKGWTATREVNRGDLADFPNVNFADPRVKWGDMSGDNLQDIVLVHDGNIEYWPNLGHGNWGKRISMRNSPRFRYGYDPRRILIGDVDGDGVDDIVYVDDRKVILWINQSGNGWSDPIEIKGTPAVSDLDAVRLVDLLGTGISGILWSADVNGLSRHHLYFLDFTGGVKPYLLAEMDNHMGSLTRVGYQPSVQFYLKDEARPATRWKTPLPFPVQVVSRVEVIDQISQGKLTTEYKYHHGYWDGAEREFRGFGRVEQCDTEIFEDYDNPGLHGAAWTFERVDQAKYFSPPLLTKTWFHQGPVGDEFGDWEEVDYQDEYWSGDPVLVERPLEIQDFLKGLPRRAKRDALRTLRGQVLRTELYAWDGSERQNRPYTVTESVSGVREEAEIATRNLPNLAETPDTRRIFFPFGLAQRTTQWERGEEPMTQFSFSEDYDVYGQPRKQIAIACARKWQRLSDARTDYLATYGESTFAQRDDQQLYIVDRAAKADSYELKLSDTARTVAELKQAALDNSVPREIISQSLTYYDGAAFQGLPLGEIGDYGMPVRTESLVLTPDLLQEGYRADENTPSTPADVPVYLNPGGSVITWSSEYPQAFQNRVDSLPDRAGYIYQDGAGSSPYVEGYYITTERQKYDFQDGAGAASRGLVLAMQDPLGHETSISYDLYRLLPESVTDALELTTQAQYDYRVMQPNLVTDPNGNRQRFGFSPLGLADWIAVMGQAGENQGDTSEQPGTWFEYDFLAFEERQESVFVHTIQRQEHRWDIVAEENRQRDNNSQPALTAAEIDLLFPDDEVEQFPDRFIQSRQYSDGFGRLIQTRAQAEAVLFGDEDFGNGTVPVTQDDEAATRASVVGRVQQGTDLYVTVSGWQVYDNKGQVVEQYEPFYSTGWGYQPPLDRQYGQKVEMYYDPRGQVVRTVNPDGSQQWVIYGIPGDMTRPDVYQPTPWEAYTYDANDLAPLSTQLQPDGTRISLQNRVPGEHYFTPSSIEIDALGRTIKAVERNGTNPQADYSTRSTYDIRGNLLTVTDALGRLSFRYAYDLADRPLRIWNVDAGLKRMVMDGAGNELERRNSVGALMLQIFDQGHRPLSLWARDKGGASMTMRQGYMYGDDASQLTDAEQRQRSLRGQLYQHWDEAGKQTLGRYDFKGNLLTQQRQALSDIAVLSGEPVNWEQTPDLDVKLYETETVYDGLNRAKAVLYPEDVQGKRKLLQPSYNRAGALEQVTLDGQIYVERIAYNAKGQRILITYGNKVMTRYAYDAQTFRLMRLRTERYSSPITVTATLTYQPTGTVLQDMAYGYDLVGNILKIQDRTPRSGVVGALQGEDALERGFQYDPLYRLLSATGRESQNIGEPRPWTDDPRGGFNAMNHGIPTQNNAPNQTQLYRESYAYDPAGNMLSLKHESLKNDNWQVSWTRNFGMGEMAPIDWDAEWKQFLNGDWANPRGNKLTHVEDRRSGVGSGPTVNQTHWFDGNGNLIRENNSRFFEWDYRDQLRKFRVQAGSGSASVEAFYCYDAAGQRVKKVVRKGNRTEVTVYVGGLFEHHRQVTVGGEKENNMLHVMDDQSRVALVRVGAAFDANVQTPAVQYHLGDHLGSSHVVVGGGTSADSGMVNREEFYPYGETSFGSSGKKRYRYSGKERDEESGLIYYGARYLASWLGRWISCDPLDPVDEMNLYLFGKNNSINNIDIAGYIATPASTAATVEGAAAVTESSAVTRVISSSSKNASRLKEALPHGSAIGSVSASSSIGESSNESGTSQSSGKFVAPEGSFSILETSILYTDGSDVSTLGHTMMRFRIQEKDSGNIHDLVFSYGLEIPEMNSVVAENRLTRFFGNENSSYGTSPFREYILNLNQEQQMHLFKEWQELANLTPQYTLISTNCATVIHDMLSQTEIGAFQNEDIFEDASGNIPTVFSDQLNNEYIQKGGKGLIKDIVDYRFGGKGYIPQKIDQELEVNENVTWKMSQTPPI